MRNLILEAREQGIELNFGDLQAGRATAQRIGSESGAPAEPAPPFPAGKEGDWLVTLGDIDVNDVDLVIANVMKLGGTTDQADCKSPEALKLLDAVSGTFMVTVDASVPVPDTSGNLFTVRRFSIEVNIANGVVSLPLRSTFGSLVREGMRLTKGDTTLIQSLGEFVSTKYAEFMCTPPEAPSTTVTGPEASTITWEERMERWKQWAGEEIERGVMKALGLIVKQVVYVKVDNYDLQWEMDKVAVTDWSTTLKLDWGSEQGVPMDLRLQLIPITTAPGRLELTLNPFTLDQAVGQAKGKPVLVRDLALDRDLTLTLDWQGVVPTRATVPIKGVEAGEVRILVPSKAE
jgi:hypothetical protein